MVMWNTHQYTDTDNLKNISDRKVYFGTFKLQIQANHLIEVIKNGRFNAEAH